MNVTKLFSDWAGLGISKKISKIWFTDNKSWELNQSEQIRQEFVNSVPANKIIIVFSKIDNFRMENKGFEYDLGGNNQRYEVGQSTQY